MNAHETLHGKKLRDSRASSAVMAQHRYFNAAVEFVHAHRYLAHRDVHRTPKRCSLQFERFANVKQHKRFSARTPLREFFDG